jgi:hypothetical protein
MGAIRPTTLGREGEPARSQGQWTKAQVRGKRSWGSRDERRDRWRGRNGKGARQAAGAGVGVDKSGSVVLLCKERASVEGLIKD